MSGIDTAEVWSREPGEGPPEFFASFDGQADLAARSGEILRAEFPAGR